MIPKKFHFVWVGDESKRPDHCIQTWSELNPDWELKVWGNAELAEVDWINRQHIDAMAKKEWNGVADMMRWEILLQHGGFALDADAICIKTLPNWLLEHQAFACWENEHARPGLIAAGYVGARAGDPLIARIVNDIKQEKTVVNKSAWKTVGPRRLTDTWKAMQYTGLSVLPSHYFMPRHHTGIEYSTDGPVFGKQLWGSTSEDGRAEIIQKRKPLFKRFFFHAPS